MEKKKQLDGILNRKVLDHSQQKEDDKFIILKLAEELNECATEAVKCITKQNAYMTEELLSEIVDVERMIAQVKFNNRNNEIFKAAYARLTKEKLYKIAGKLGLVNAS